MAALLLGAQSCGPRSGPEVFKALGLRSGEGPIYRNEPVIIRFNRRLAPDPPSTQAVVLRGREGRDVPYRMQVRGRFLSLWPQSPLGWPPAPELQVILRWPPPGGGVRSLDGAWLGEGFKRRVELLLDYRPKAGSLEVVAVEAEAGALSGGSPGSQVTLRFNAPLEPQTIHEGIVVRDVRTGERHPAVSIHQDPRDPNAVVLSLMQPTGDPAVAYRPLSGTFWVGVTPDLASLDHRRPVHAETVTALEPQTPTHGRVLVSFSHPSDFAPQSRHLCDGSGTLKPPLPTPHVEPVPREAPPPGGWKRQPEILRAGPTRAQLRIPAADLPGGGLRPFHVDQIWVFCAPGIDPAAQVLDPRVLLGYGPSGSFAAEFRLNQERLAHGHVTSRRLTFRRPSDSDCTVAVITFPEPFAYEGLGLDLLLELEHAGVQTPYGAGAIPLQARKAGEERAGELVVGSPEERYGRIGESFLPRLALVTHTYTQVITRWYRLPPLKSPALDHDPLRDVVGTARESRDFHIAYQGLVLQPDGSELQTEWSSLPPRGRVLAIRLRIEFIERNAGPGEEPPEIEHILLHFREGAEHRNK